LATKRREWVMREEERRDEARRAHWAANVRERGVFRGQFFMTFSQLKIASEVNQTVIKVCQKIIMIQIFQH
jgi:hypothetical protein